MEELQCKSSKNGAMIKEIPSSFLDTVSKAPSVINFSRVSKL
jgi:hypothetical protein